MDILNRILKTKKSPDLTLFQKMQIFFTQEQKKLDGKIISNGGRVLGVTALGDSLESAITNAYDVANKVSWPHKYCRKDIGKKGLSYL